MCFQNSYSEVEQVSAQMLSKRFGDKAKPILQPK